MASPAPASVDAASSRNGALGAWGEIGSENEAIPGQCRVVVACGNPSPASDENVKYTAGSPCETRPEVILPQYEALGPRGEQTGPGGAGVGGKDRGRRDPFP